MSCHVKPAKCLLSWKRGRFPGTAAACLLSGRNRNEPERSTKSKKGRSIKQRKSSKKGFSRQWRTVVNWQVSLFCTVRRKDPWKHCGWDYAFVVYWRGRVTQKAGPSKRADTHSLTAVALLIVSDARIVLGAMPTCAPWATLSWALGKIFSWTCSLLLAISTFFKPQH